MVDGLHALADFPVRARDRPVYRRHRRFVTKLEGLRRARVLDLRGGSFTDARPDSKSSARPRRRRGLHELDRFPVVSPIFGTSAGLDGFVFELAASGPP
jgi:hypothetical protein